MVVLRDPSGLAEGISAIGTTLGKTLGDVATKRAQMSQLQQILNPQAPNVSEDPAFRQNFLDQVMNLEQQSGQKFTEPELDQLWNRSVAQAQSQAQPQETSGIGKYAALATINPQLAAMMQQEDLAKQRIGLQEKKIEQQQKLAYQKMNEPLVQKLNEKLQKTKQTGYDFERLDKIFTDEASKLPSAFTAAMVDLEGPSGLSKIARTQISPEAQEVIKLVVNQLRGARETFGARVTNFEADKFLLGLPGLLNTPEGRKAILRDLRIVNKINQIHDQGIIEAFNQAGGTGAITYSQAARLAEKKYAPQIEQLRQMYVNPKKRDFAAMPDASLLRGEKLIDENTGQQFISNGSEWVPIREGEK